MFHTYIIGEIGQNHNGEVDTAKQIIDVMAAPVTDELFGQELKPMDAVKFTKRDLSEELSAEASLEPYDNPNSFGKTYGEHRAFLELNDEQHHELYEYAKSKGLEFIETLCAKGCLTMLDKFTPDKLKVASRDLSNLPLLEVLAETKIPIILSTGMAGQSELDEALEIVTKHHDQISILHCISQYPSEYSNINLNSIPYLKQHYPDYTIGYSDHSIGIMIPVAAVSLGASMIEKHVTLDRGMKGTDHKGSLGPDGIFRMVRDIRNVEKSFGKNDIFIDESVTGVREKLERSIASSQEIAEGAVITEAYLHLLSPGNGLKWIERDKIIGKKALEKISKDSIIYENMIE
ncbi:MAG: N-acetylneuraminate synthase family protein [Bacteroidetes bacterium]|nr:N-acetylneuraminate synthase family protein [Bacteroidota bacterium]